MNGLIRQSAFEKEGTFLKGALHSHSKRSDGLLEPGDVIRLYKEHGYNFVSLTDHRIYNYENYAPETEMTIIPGMEIDRSQHHIAHHCHHIVVLGPEKKNGNPIEQDQLFRDEPSFEDSDYLMQKILDSFHDKGQFTIYCHPEWSGVTAKEIKALKGNFAMEIFNSGSSIGCGLDTNAAYWDELLADGIKIYGVATDDGHYKYDFCNGWVMVKSANNIGDILTNLANGAFYSSTGPEIYDFYVKDGHAYIECSEVDKIQFRHLSLPYHQISADEGKTLTSGSVKLFPGLNYIRATIIDKKGRHAWTNLIFFN